MFNKKISEFPLWQVILFMAAAVVIGVVVHDFFVVDNIVSTNSAGSFVKKSFFSPLSAERKAEIAADFEAKQAEKAAKA